MDGNRRTFIKLGGLAGIGLFGAHAAGSSPASDGPIPDPRSQKRAPHFNMCGYAAPKLETVRVGFVGIGMRGINAVKRFVHLEGSQVQAICDLREERLALAENHLTKSTRPPERYSGNPEAWKRLCDRDDIDLVYICTPWEWHVPMAVYAMERGKHVAVEVPAATTLEECWQLVETSEATRRHCMMLENCCYDFFELLTLNMAQQGVFGEIVHGEGAYIHELLKLNFDREGYQGMWRLRENAQRNGNLYPTHGLGPICQVMNINRGDQMDFLVSVSSDDFQMAEQARLRAHEDPFFEAFADVRFRGNMNTTTIRTKLGRTIMVQHDVTSPRPYTRIHLISGTKGIARKWPTPARVATGHSWLSEDEFKALEEAYTPEIVHKVGAMARQIGGHGGMDTIMDWRLVDCLRNGLALDQDVYDAALWSAIAPLSEWSVAHRSNSIDVPDFTGGHWETNAPIDISLRGGGSTRIVA